MSTIDRCPSLYRLNKIIYPNNKLLISQSFRNKIETRSNITTIGNHTYKNYELAVDHIIRNIDSEVTDTLPTAFKIIRCFIKNKTEPLAGDYFYIKFSKIGSSGSLNIQYNTGVTGPAITINNEETQNFKFTVNNVEFGSEAISVEFIT